MEPFDDRLDRNLDHDREDVTMLDGVHRRVEGQLARKVRADRGLDVHEERVAGEPREGAHAALVGGLADDDAHLAPVRRGDAPLLRRPFRRVVEGYVDDVFGRAGRDAAGRPGERPQPEAVGHHIAEPRLRRRQGKYVHDEDEVPGAFGAGERVEIGDVDRRVAQHRRSAEMV